MRRPSSPFTLLMLVVLLFGSFPSAQVVAQPVPAPSATPPAASITTPSTGLQIPNPHLPSLVVRLEVAPELIAIGDTAVLTVTVTNQAPDPAKNLLVTVPTPDGTLAVPGTNTVSPTRGWRWSQPQLDGNHSSVFTGALRLVRLPRGSALLAHSQVTAQGISMPIAATSGALVVDRARSAMSAAFTPGTATVLRSADGQVTARIPAQGFARRLTLRHTPHPALPAIPAGRKHGFAPFMLDATDDQGAAIQQFTQPLTISIAYTPEQLEALGIAADDLTLFQFNTQQQTWTPLGTTVDTTAQLITAAATAPGEFQLGDGASPSEAYIPSVQGWQVSMFTGAATYSYPIEVPAGPTGLKPNLALNYNSAATDGATGLRQKQQTSWVGKGWSLDVGSVALNRVTYGGVHTYSYYTLILNGQSFDLVRTVPLTTGTDITNPTLWEWHPTDETFIRARVVKIGTSVMSSQPDGSHSTHSGDNPNDGFGRGGERDGSLLPRYKWQIWAKDGTLYEFQEDLWWGWDACAAQEAQIETYKWLLSRVIDTHQNTITYHYDRDTYAGHLLDCSSPGRDGKAAVDRDAWLTNITWGGNINPSVSTPDRYKVVFTSMPRVGDTAFETASRQYDGTEGTPRETRQLQAIQVLSNISQPYQDTAWLPVRQYTFDIDVGLYSDARICDPGCRPQDVNASKVVTPSKLRLRNITQKGKNGTALPVTCFAYSQPTLSSLQPPCNDVIENGGTAYYAQGGWNRLTQVTNGQGGQINFEYENIGTVLGQRDLFRNNHRVSKKRVLDGLGHGYYWSYAYGDPNYNSLGSVRAPQAPGSWHDPDYGTKAYPNSAALYFNAFYSTWDNEDQLAHRRLKEFRGHDWVVETDPNGAQTRHRFYQGEAVDASGNPTQCIPSATKDAILGDPCFQQLRNGEFLKGREYLSRVFAPGVDVTGDKFLRETQHNFVVDFRDYGNVILSGLWHAFSYESQTSEVAKEGGALTRPKTTKYIYSPSCDPTAAVDAYGNLGCIQELNAVNGPARTTRRWYTTRADGLTNGVWGSYIVDRMYQESIYDEGGYLKALTNQFYDGTAVANAAPTIGELRRTTRYFDIPLNVSSAQGITLHGSDTTYGYDGWGNRTTSTTYTGASTRDFNGTTTTWGPVTGNTRTTTTTYDPTFHVFSSAVTQPAATNGATPLTEQAGYDYRMGTLTSVTDANGVSSSAEYDAFGRMIKLIKPGDSSAAPTVQAMYHDVDVPLVLPLRYEVQRRDTSADGVRVIEQFYDGLGRNIQTKSESQDNGAQSIVTDMRYDGLNQVIEQSQARYVTESGSFATYTNPGSGSLYNATTTTYDALGRVSTVTTPDGATTSHFYLVWNDNNVPRVAHNVVDAKRHRTKYSTDVFDRLVKVEEISGNCGQWTFSCGGAYTTQWTAYATTNYLYTALDTLSSVTDTNGNLTSISFDSLGRKTNMTDPDMGAWAYQYDVNGNLIQQTDARGKRLCFYYDNLDRLTGKHYQDSSSACPAASPNTTGDTSYGYDQGTNGLGRRTTMSVSGGASTSWSYDARGRTSDATYTNVPGLAAGQSRKFHWQYDSADRVQTLTYPTTASVPAESVTYTYDAAWRQTQVSNGTTTYANASQPYTALDQPTQWSFGNGAFQTWSYDPTMQRLSHLQVGVSGSPGSMLDRTYDYDPVGNVATMTDAGSPTVVQAFDYDHRDRLVHSGPTHQATAGLAAALHPVAAEPARSPVSTTSATPTLTQDMEPGLSAAQEPVLPLPPTTQSSAPTASAPAAAQPSASTVAAAPQAPATPTRPDFSHLPLAFIPNRGQTDARARYIVHGAGGVLFFAGDETVLALPDPTDAFSTTVVRLRYQGANSAPTLTAQEQLPGVVNYLIGDNPAQWQTNLPTFASLSYTALYPGIDLRYDGTDGTLKSTYVVAPGADPSQIHWRYLGATDLQVDADGNLVVLLPGRGWFHTSRTLTEHAPVAWQEIGGQRVAVTARFVVAPNKSVSFALGSYDPSQPLLIDPILTYSTYHGGTGTDKANAIAVDSSGNAYITGYTYSSSSFPTQSPLYTFKGSTDAFVSKLNAAGTALVWSTYLGGSNEDKADAIALDGSNNVIVTGETSSGGATPFPTKNALDSSYASGGGCTAGLCSDAFVTKLSAAGTSLLYSTFLGGTGVEEATSVALDTSGKIYTTGVISSTSGLTMKNAYDSSANGGADAFVVKLDPAQSGSASLLYSTYLGGSADEQGNGIAVDSSGKILLTGETYSNNFPTKNAAQTANAGQADVFVVKLDTSKTTTAQLLYGTYLGGRSYDKGLGLVADSSGNAYVTGYSQSLNFPTQNAWQSSNAGDKDAILVKVNPAASGAASLVYSSYIGGSDEDRGLAIARDSSGTLYLTGLTRSSDYITQNPLQASFGGGTCGTISCTDTFVTAFDLTRNTPAYSTFLGGTKDDQGTGIAVDASGAAYVTGFTASADFPLAGARQGVSGGGTDAFIAKLTQPTVKLSAASASVNESAGSVSLTVSLSAASASPVTVGYATSDGTAKGGSDYTAQAGTLVFAVGQTSQTISVPISNDPIREPSETFTVALSNPANAVLASPSSATVTITDDDPAPTVAWQSASVSAGEGGGSALVVVVLSNPSTYTITVQYATSNGTATAGADYTATSGTLTFPPLSTEQSVRVPLLNDTLQESAETVNLALTSPTNASLGTASATLTILDDDTPVQAPDEYYNYDALGNLVNKAGKPYSYGTQASTCATGALSKPHAVVNDGLTSYCYDQNGNMLAGGGRIYQWDAENRPTSINSTSGNETYSYDADGERISRVAGSTTTAYLGGLWEETNAGVVKKYYTLNSTVVALWDSSDAGNVRYLHSDHLGSVSVVSGTGGVRLSSQSYDPWGKVRSGGTVTQTDRNYTGQTLDSTGLLFYHARYYDPGLGRFVSADSVVPSSASGSLDGVALRPLTVDFHEPGFVGTLSKENGRGFWFQLSDEDKKQAGEPWGPQNPQALNRYSYTWNNPMRWTDPSGHWTVSWCVLCGIGGAGGAGRFSLSIAFDDQGNVAILGGLGGGGFIGAGGGIGSSITVTNAPSVENLKGWSVQVGGQAGEIVGINVEGVVIPNGKSKPYGGLTVGGKLLLEAPLPAEGHLTAEYDWGVSGNIKSTVKTVYAGVKGIYDEGKRRLRQYVDPVLGP